MQVFEGHSEDADSKRAVSEAIKDWPVDDAQQPEIIFVFHSTKQNSQKIAQILSERFPNSIITGCTTAGEWRTGHYQSQSLVLTGILSSKIHWALEVIESLDDFNAATASHIYNALLEKLDVRRSDLTPKRHFCIGLIDGMTGLDGAAVAAMANELGNVPFLGGIAGDDLKFEKTYVIANGTAISGGAVFILAESDEPFKCIKHQHFVPGNIDMVISKADELERKVLRLDGKPAAAHYARLLGLKVEELNFQVFSDHPLIYVYGGEPYVRSIQSVGDDGSLIFYCAIEEGMVLNLCEHRDMASELKQSASGMVDDSGKAKLLFMCNCVFRSLEAEGQAQSQILARHVATVASHVIGFNTYGELWNGLHINQTLVALALGRE